MALNRENLKSMRPTRGFSKGQRSELRDAYVVVTEEQITRLNEALQGSRMSVGDGRTTRDGRLVLNAALLTDCCVSESDNYWPGRDILGTLEPIRIPRGQFPRDLQPDGEATALE